MGRYDREKYKQIIININTKKALDKVRTSANARSYNETINMLVKSFYAHEHSPSLYH